MPQTYIKDPTPLLDSMGIVELKRILADRKQKQAHAKLERDMIDRDIKLMDSVITGLEAAIEMRKK